MCGSGQCFRVPLSTLVGVLLGASPPKAYQSPSVCYVMIEPSEAEGILSRPRAAQKPTHFVLLPSDAGFIIDLLRAPWGVARQSHFGDISTCFMSTDLAASLTRPPVRICDSYAMIIAYGAQTRPGPGTAPEPQGSGAGRTEVHASSSRRQPVRSARGRDRCVPPRCARRPRDP